MYSTLRILASTFIRTREPRPSSSRSSTSHSSTASCHSGNDSKSVNAAMILSGGAWMVSVRPALSLPMTSDPFEDGAGRQCAAGAHRDERSGGVAPFEFVQCRRDQARPGAADRMAERDRAPVDVQL